MALMETLRWRSAVVEGFAVLVGILLAFGIDAAWDARAGGLSQIESVPLRRALSEYQRSLVDDEVRQAAIITNFGRIRDYTVAEGGMSATHWEQWVGVSESSANFALPVEAFAANRTYANLLVNRRQSFSSMRAARLTVLDRIETVLAIMEGAI